MLKEKIRLQKTTDSGKTIKTTLLISGRTVEELQGRVEKQINRYFHNGWELR